MEKLPDSSYTQQQVMDKVEKITAGLLQIAQRGGYSLPQIVEIWSSIPTRDSTETTYLEDANRTILSVTDLVDQTYPQLPQEVRAVRKLGLMGELLSLKADQLS